MSRSSHASTSEAYQPFPHPPYSPEQQHRHHHSHHQHHQTQGQHQHQHQYQHQHPHQHPSHPPPQHRQSYDYRRSSVDPRDSYGHWSEPDSSMAAPPGPPPRSSLRSSSSSTLATNLRYQDHYQSPPEPLSPSMSSPPHTAASQYSQQHHNYSSNGHASNSYDSPPPPAHAIPSSKHHHPPPPHHLHRDRSSSSSQVNQEPPHHRNPVAARSSEPSFTSRPHSRSFSSLTHPQPQYPPPNPPSSSTSSTSSSNAPSPPYNQPRLHHSTSAGHLTAAGQRSSLMSSSSLAAATPLSGLNASNMSNSATDPSLATTATTGPKKKDPYATAWRTYSKIAEELNLLNPDGSLYPISRDAILKYLRHQAKRIKSSNLHWYVNGLKKHQENLGFPWDTIRYDDQVVALLKELTLHPVTIEFPSLHHQQQQQQLLKQQQQLQQQQQQQQQHNQSQGGGRQRQYTGSGPIDTAKIANLSISSRGAAGGGSPQSPLEPSQQQPGYYTNGDGHNYSKQQQLSSSHAYPFLEQAPAMSSNSRQQQYPQSQKASSSNRHKNAYHSAPVQLPSSSSTSAWADGAYQTQTMNSAGGSASQQQATSPSSPPTTFSGGPASARSPYSSGEINVYPQYQGSNVKRKRQDLSGTLASPRSPERGVDGLTIDGAEGGLLPGVGEDIDRDHGMDEDDDLRPHMNLKRHASAGTLRVLSKAGASAEYPQSSGRDYNLTTPSPGVKGENEGRHFRWGSSDVALVQKNPVSPPLGSASPFFGSSPSRNSGSPTTSRHRRANGVVSSPITLPAGSTSMSGFSAESVPPVPTQPPSISTTSPVSGGAGKNTVQFSEVVEYAQRLQTQYGKRCRDHPWGCVELSPEEPHLELTIKMYMDWAGLVASGRLTMDELPDLPEFKRTEGTFSITPPPLPKLPHPPVVYLPSSIQQQQQQQQQQRHARARSGSNNNGSHHSSSGTLRRMMSSPLTTSFRSFSLSASDNRDMDDVEAGDGHRDEDVLGRGEGGVELKTEQLSPELEKEGAEEEEMEITQIPTIASAPMDASAATTDMDMDQNPSDDPEDGQGSRGHGLDEKDQSHHYDHDYEQSHSPAQQQTLSGRQDEDVTKSLEDQSMDEDDPPLPVETESKIKELKNEGPVGLGKEI